MLTAPDCLISSLVTTEIATGDEAIFCSRFEAVTIICSPYKAVSSSIATSWEKEFAEKIKSRKNMKSKVKSKKIKSKKRIQKGG